MDSELTPIVAVATLATIVMATLIQWPGGRVSLSISLVFCFIAALFIGTAAGILQLWGGSGASVRFPTLDAWRLLR